MTHDQKVARLFELFGAPAEGERLLEWMMQEMGGEISPEVLEAFHQLARAEPLAPRLVPLFASRLTEGDVDALIAAFESASWKRYCRVRQELTGAVLEVAKAWGVELATRAVQQTGVRS